jgi:heme oxygenase (biliverdin-IX-beta and delta-forming)
LPGSPASSTARGGVTAPTPRGSEHDTLHIALRAATQDVHQRLHHHPGFAALQAGQIDLADYRALLARLTGFYAPFEISAGVRPERTRRLTADLAALGTPPVAPETLPRCPYIPRLATPSRRIGALYVVEGAALGGRQLAKSLDSLLGPDVAAGRNFFLGRGAATGATWRAFITRLETFARDPLACAEIIVAARETFAAIERWLDGWKPPELAH